MMGDTALIQLANRARTDADFRQRLRDDLEGTIQAEGYELSGEDLEAVRSVHARVKDLSDQEIIEELSGDVGGQGG